MVGIYAANNVSGDGAARAIKDNNAADRIPVVAFDADPQEIAALKDGTLDALIVQNPYFFGYQGLVEALSASVGNLQPETLAPEVVLAEKTNMNEPAVKQLLNPPTAKAG
jgi:ribose transport system substrate-binding protein